LYAPVYREKIEKYSSPDIILKKIKINGIFLKDMEVKGCQ